MDLDNPTTRPNQAPPEILSRSTGGVFLARWCSGNTPALALDAGLAGESGFDSHQGRFNYVNTRLARPPVTTGERAFLIQQDPLESGGTPRLLRLQISGEAQKPERAS